MEPIQKTDVSPSGRMAREMSSGATAAAIGVGAAQLIIANNPELGGYAETIGIVIAGAANALFGIARRFLRF